MIQFQLRTTDWTNDYKDLYNLMNNEDGIKEIFFNRHDRVANSEISKMIKVNGKNIGFINLVREKMNRDYLFLDIGIIEEYRGKGIGKQAIKRIKEMIEGKLREFVLIETEIDNIGANNAVKDIGCFLSAFGDRNVYLLQTERITEFIDNDHMEKLSNHFAQPNTKREFLR